MKMVLMLVSLARLCLLVCLLPLTAAAACATAGPAATVETKQQPGQLVIVTAFYPLQFVAQRVADDHATVTSLTQPGAEPHDLELTPRQVASLTTANLVIYQKGFQAAVDEAVTQSENSEVIDTTTVVSLRPPVTGDQLDHGEEAQHDHAALDPHVWLDPTSVTRIARAVEERLSRIDPDHAADYARNADRLVHQLNNLDRSFRQGLAHCVRTEFMTTHAAFGYLAARYDLTQIAITGLSPDLEPAPARIADVQHQAQHHGITTIFSETLVSPALAQAIAGDLGLATDVLDPVEGITSQSRGQDYLSVMYANLAALRKAGGCS
jgi:zinc transport system substrate-binding protein